MGKLLNFIITVLIILFFVGCGLALFKSSAFVNEQVGNVKSGANSLTEKASSMGQSIAELPGKAVDMVAGEQGEGQNKAAEEGENKENAEESDLEDLYESEEGEEAKEAAASEDATKTEAKTEVEAKKSEAIAEAKKEIPQEYNTVAKKAPNNASSKPNRSSSGAPYMVITGSFAKEVNAASEVNRLKEMGFPNAEARYLGSTKYLSVIAERYFSQTDALATVKRIQATGVEAYVHKRKKKK